MPFASAIRLQIESALASRIPSALTPAPRIIRPVAPTGVTAVDELLEGGLPLGAITEMVGPECSGRSSLALSFVAGITRAGNVCAWIDVSNALDPESAAVAGVDLTRLLWVRCGVAAKQPQTPAKYGFTLPDKYLIAAPAKQGLHGGGFGPHPCTEAKGLPEAVNGLFQREAIAPRCAEPQPRARREREVFTPMPQPFVQRAQARVLAGTPWSRIEQALRVANLLLQSGGFRAIVLDLASIAPEHSVRVPLATWFRYRAAAERTQASVLLLTQHSCAKSSGELLLRFQPGKARADESTVFAGIEHRLEVERRRFTQLPTNVVPLRKPPQSESVARWRSQTAWAGTR